VVVTLDRMHLVSAMFGDIAMVAPFDGEKLGDFHQAATRDGQIARQHLYLSAVVVLYPRGDQFVVSIYETPCYEATPLPDSALAAALNHRSGVLDMNTGSYGINGTGRCASASPSAARRGPTAHPRGWAHARRGRGVSVYSSARIRSTWRWASAIVSSADLLSAQGSSCTRASAIHFWSSAMARARASRAVARHAPGVGKATIRAIKRER
jgi:hypothetical protein